MMSQSPRPALRRLASSLAALALIVVVAACAGSAPRATPSPIGGRMDDGEIAAILLLSGNVAIGQSSLVARQSSDPLVLAYAARVRTDRSAMNAELVELAGRLDLVVRDPAGATSLRELATAQRVRLAGLKGRAFDVAYLDAELQLQRDALALLEGAVLPGASRRALREHAEALRPVVQAHAAHAEQLRATLTVGP